MDNKKRKSHELNHSKQGQEQVPRWGISSRTLASLDSKTLSDGGSLNTIEIENRTEISIKRATKIPISLIRLSTHFLSTSLDTLWLSGSGLNPGSPSEFFLTRFIHAECSLTYHKKTKKGAILFKWVQQESFASMADSFTESTTETQPLEGRGGRKETGFSAVWSTVRVLTTKH